MKQRPEGVSTRNILADNAFLIRDNQEEAGDDNGVNGGRRIRERVRVSVLEGAVGQAAGGLARDSAAADEGEREIDAGGAEIGELFGEATSIKARAAAELEQTGTRTGADRRKEREGDLLGVIAEEVLAAEGIEPSPALEEAFRWFGSAPGV